jgi:hypothetical protein
MVRSSTRTCAVRERHLALPDVARDNPRCVGIFDSTWALWVGIGACGTASEAGGVSNAAAHAKL